MAIDPSGDYLFSCNQKGDSITSFRINSRSGALQFTGRFEPVGSPAVMTLLKPRWSDHRCTCARTGIYTERPVRWRDGGRIMDIAMIGLGRMGANMALRLLRGGHRVVGFDPAAAARKLIEEKGAESAVSLEALVGKLKAPRVLWLMVPAGAVTDGTIDALTPLLAAGDTLIDGGNSNYRDTQRRAASARAAADPLRRLGHERRHLGPRGRL